MIIISAWAIAQIMNIKADNIMVCAIATLETAVTLTELIALAENAIAHAIYNAETTDNIVLAYQLLDDVKVLDTFVEQAAQRLRN